MSSSLDTVSALMVDPLRLTFHLATDTCVVSTNDTT